MIKYVLIVTEEKNDDVMYYANNPHEGLLRDIVFGVNADSLMKRENEGMFYQLYVLDTGEKIGYGILDKLSLEDDINYYKKGKV